MAESELWQLTDHVCRYCTGRLLKGESGFRCAECGRTAPELTALCWCGVENGGAISFECIKNPNKTAQQPQEVLVRDRRKITVTGARELEGLNGESR